MALEGLAQDRLEWMTEHVVARAGRVVGEQFALHHEVRLREMGFPRDRDQQPGGGSGGRGGNRQTEPGGLGPDRGGHRATERLRGHRELLRAHAAGTAQGGAHQPGGEPRGRLGLLVPQAEGPQRERDEPRAPPRAHEEVGPVSLDAGDVTPPLALVPPRSGGRATALRSE
jgi:hypothetical protein